ncbi:hypothetical protein [Nostocoides veronense]|uniref:Thioredoxin domain-containing protein n=1 Tax=Nostocoides veronense TaxID=330836 RepID=A0ABP4XP67_9MICO
MSFTAAALTLAWIALALLALVCAGLLRMVTDLRSRPRETSAEGIDARRLVGFGLPSSGPASAVRPPGGGIVLFSSPSCPTCAAVLAEIAKLGPRLVVVSLGDCAGTAAGAPRAHCIPQAGELFDRLGIPAAPFLLAVDAAGTITSSLLPESAAQVATWLEAAARLDPAPPIPAPEESR